MAVLGNDAVPIKTTTHHHSLYP